MTTLQIHEGAIFDFSGTKIIDAFPIVEELSVNDNLPEEITFPIVCNPSFEVSLIRIFYDEKDDEWCISTSRKLDATKSYWGSRISFGQKFFEVVHDTSGMFSDEFLVTLNKDRVYFFLLPTYDESRIGTMNNPLKPVFFLGGIQDKGKELVYGPDLPIDENNAWSYLPVFKLNNVDEMKNFIHNNYIESLNRPTLCIHTGIVIFSHGKMFRVMHPSYLYMMKLRDNDCNVYHRYVQLLKLNDYEDIQIFEKQHPSIAWFKERLNKYLLEIKSLYIQRHIHREFIEMDGIQKKLLYLLHKQFIETKKQTNISAVRRVVLSELEFKTLNRKLVVDK